MKLWHCVTRLQVRPVGVRAEAMLPNCSVAAVGSVIIMHTLAVRVRTLCGACSHIIVDVPRNVRRDPSSTDDPAGMEALLDTCVIVLVETLTLSYLCRLNTCLVDSAVSLNRLGFTMNKHTYLIVLCLWFVIVQVRL